MSKTRKNGRGSTTRGWKNEQPGYRQRTLMLKKCGRKCFLPSGETVSIPCACEMEAQPQAIPGTNGQRRARGGHSVR